MGTLLLKLAGPLQAWGSDGRYRDRKTRHEPTKSGVIGLLASALGRRREDSIDDLASFPVGVRIDQPGTLERDYQTSHKRKYDKDTGVWRSDGDPFLTHRYYLADAVFVAGIEVPDNLLEAYGHAFDHPAFPLYLGRRSCPPTDRVLLALQEGVGLVEALAQQPWQAMSWPLVKKHRDDANVTLEVLRDELATDGDVPIYEDVRDIPVSFSQLFRQYAWRRVVHTSISVPNPHHVSIDHDPFEALEEVD